MLCEEERTLDGTPQESDVWTQATWLKLPFWFKQSPANFSNELDAVGFFDCFGVVIQLLAGNCLPYHQPCPITYNPRKCCSLPGFMLKVRGRSFCLHAFLGVLLPTTLVHSQLHQKHLMRTTCFDGAPSGNERSANIQPFFQSRLMSNRFLGVKVIGSLPYQVTSFFRPLQRVENCVDFCFS